MTRGEIWWVDFGVPIGSAAGFRRPALVLQSNEYNSTDINTVIVVPLTSNIRLAEYKPNVIITKVDSRLNKDSVALIPLITALDKMCFIERISKVSEKTTDAVYDAVLELIK